MASIFLMVVALLTETGRSKNIIVQKFGVKPTLSQCPFDIFSRIYLISPKPKIKAIGLFDRWLAGYKKYFVESTLQHRKKGF